MKCGETLTKKKLQDMAAQGWVISVYDKNGEADNKSIGIDKFEYLIKQVDEPNKILRVERID